MDTTAKPNSYSFGPAGRAYGTPLRLWNPAWMGIFGGPPLPTIADADGQALYVELTATYLGTYPTGTTLPHLVARPAGALAAKGVDYSIGGGQWLVNPDDGNASFPATVFMYPTAAPPGAGLRNNAAFQTGSPAQAAAQATWIARADTSAYWTALGTYYSSSSTGVANGGLYSSNGLFSGILPDVMGPYPTQQFSNLNGDPAPWNFDTSATGMYTANRWMDFIVAGITTMRGVLGGSGNMGANGLVDGIKYFDPVAPTSRLLMACDYAMAEEWIRNSNALASPTAFVMTEANWQKNVDMLYHGAAAGKSILVCSKLWPSAGAATLAQSKQWFNFLLGSFLLGNANNAACGKNWFHYRHDNPNVAYVAGTDGDGSGNDMKGRHNWRPDVNFFGTGTNWFDLANCLGRNVTHVNYPTQGVASLKFADTYVAHFENGYVLVNPTTTNAAASRLTLPTLSGGQQWKALDGTVYSGAVPALAARTALIITNPTAVSTIEVWDSPTATWNSPTVGWDGYAVDTTIKRGVGALVGVGTLAATGGKVKIHAIGAIVGTGTLAGTGTIGTQITGAIVGRGTLAGTGHIKTRGAGGVVGSGTLAGRGTVGGIIPPSPDRQFRIGKQTGGSRLGGLDRLGGRIGHVGAPAIQFHIGGANASRIGGLDRIGGITEFVTDTFNGVGNVTGTGSLAGTAKVKRHGIGGLVGTGSLAATAHRKVHGHGGVVGGGALIATGRKRIKGRGGLTGAGSMSATSTRKVKGHGALLGTGTLAARGQIAGRISGDLRGTGALAGVGHVRIHGHGGVVGTGTLTGRSTFSRGRGGVVGVGILIATPHSTQFGVGDVLGTGTLAALGTVLEQGHGADFGPTRALVGVGSGRNRVDLLGTHDDEDLA